MKLLPSMFMVLALGVGSGCDDTKKEPPAQSEQALTEQAEQAPEGASENEVCDRYARTVREVCIASWEDGLDVPCHRVVTRANVAIATQNAELCEQHQNDLKAERAKKLGTVQPVELGEACRAFVSTIQTKCLDRLGDGYPAQCGGAMVTVGELGPDAEERCKGMAAMLSRL